MANLKALADAIIKGDQNAAVKATKDALGQGVAAEKVLNEGLIAGMDVIGARFKKNEVYIPEVLIAARAMKASMQILEPELSKSRRRTNRQVYHRHRPGRPARHRQKPRRDDAQRCGLRSR